MARWVKIAAAQMGPINEGTSREECVDRMLALLEHAIADHVELIAYPEMALTTYFPKRIRDDYEQFFEVDGQRFSHILDPRSGFPARGTRSATVLAESATDTDALSTAAFVLGEGGLARLLERFPGIGIVLVPDSGSARTERVLTAGEVDFSPCQDAGDHKE